MVRFCSSLFATDASHSTVVVPSATASAAADAKAKRRDLRDCCWRPELDEEAVRPQLSALKRRNDTELAPKAGAEARRRDARAMERRELRLRTDMMAIESRLVQC